MTYYFFIANFVSTIILFSFGSFFSKIIFYKFKNPKLEEFGFYGFIFLSFLALLIHFFFPLNEVFGNLVLILGLVIFVLNFKNSNKKLETLIYLIIVSLTSVLLLYASNINRPDAGLYHLPYINFIQENKIILGISNVHHRFGHISIVQYISGIYNSTLFVKEYITVPLANIFAFFFYYLVKLVLSFKNFNDLRNLFFVILSIFSFYSFNRYSNYGNDAPTHLFFFLLIINILFIEKLKPEDLIKINLFAVFCFLNKTFMVIVLLIPIFLNSYYFYKTKKIFFDRSAFIAIFFLLIWTIKNILVSGCLIYPVPSTCIEKLDYVDLKKTKIVEIEGIAWSKEIKNEQVLKLPREEYIKDFNWLNGWLKFHFKKILEKILPLIILLLLILIIKLYSSKKKIKKFKLDKNILCIFFFSNLFLLIWFLKFPLYRFGLSFISVSLISFACLIYSSLEVKSETKFFKNLSLLLILLSISGILFKNLYRIINHENIYYVNYPWPKIYTLSEKDENLPVKNDKIYSTNGKFIYYFSDKECMYNKSPCSNYKYNNLEVKYLFNYKIIFPN